MEPSEMNFRGRIIIRIRPLLPQGLFIAYMQDIKVRLRTQV